MKIRNMVILAVLAAVVLVFLSGCDMCAPREPLNADVFLEVMESEGYEVIDVLYENEGMAEAFNTFLVVIGEDYRFEFAEFAAEEYAITAFASAQAYIESARGATRSYRQVNLANYSLFEQTSAGAFAYVYRVDNAILRVNSDVEYSPHVRTLLDRIR